MVRIEMLDDFGNVTEVCEATASPGVTCGGAISFGRLGFCDGPVYQWRADNGTEYESCKLHIETDDFSRFA